MASGNRLRGAEPASDARPSNRFLGAILRPDAEDELAALDLFARFADQEVSFTDCTSFALMRRHRLSRAFTFDRHFLAAGFDVLPPR